MADTTTYKDPNGNYQTGYFIDGHTYTDPEGKTKVPVGSIVLAGGSLWEQTDLGGVRYQPPEQISQPSSSEKIINDIYDKKMATQKAALTSVYDQNVNTIKAQKEAIPQTYQEAKNTTASQSEVQKANFNEYAAASGLNSGTGGQAQLAFGNQLQGNLSALDKEQAKQISSLDLQMTQLQTKYKNDVAAAFAAGDTERIKMLYQQLQNDKANATAQANTEYQRKVYNAETLAQYGDFSGYSALDYQPEQINKMQKTYIKANTKAPSSGGTVSSGNISTLYQDMNASGNPVLFLQANYKKYGIASGGIDAVLSEYNNWVDGTSGNYDVVLRQAQGMIGAMGIGGVGAINPTEITDYLSRAVDAGDITISDSVKILRQLGLT